MEPTSLQNKWHWLLKRPKVVAYLAGHAIARRATSICNLWHIRASNYLDKTGDVFG